MRNIDFAITEENSFGEDLKEVLIGYQKNGDKNFISSEDLLSDTR